MNNLNGKRILITGGNGFVGSHLINSIFSKYDGVELHVIDIFEYNPNSLIDNHKKIRFHKADIRDREEIIALVQNIKPNYIFHLAAFVNPDRSSSNFEKAISINVIGTLNLLYSINGFKLEKFVHMSTSEVYGSNKVPFKEDMRLDPKSPYSISKATSEYISIPYCRMNEIPAVFIRCFNLYGPGQSETMLIPYVIKSCIEGLDIDVTEGIQTRENNYVGDIVDGLIISALESSSTDQIINLGCGEEVSVKDLVNKIVDLCHSKSKVNFGKLPYRENEIWRMFCDNSKAKEIIGWEPKISLDNGLIETIAWYRQKI